MKIGDFRWVNSQWIKFSNKLFPRWYKGHYEIQMKRNGLLAVDHLYIAKVISKLLKQLKREKE